jgi:hypothetical protein
VGHTVKGEGRKKNTDTHTQAKISVGNERELNKGKEAAGDAMMLLLHNLITTHHTCVDPQTPGAGQTSARGGAEGED